MGAEPGHEPEYFPAGPGAHCADDHLHFRAADHAQRTGGPRKSLRLPARQPIDSCARDLGALALATGLRRQPDLEPDRRDRLPDVEGTASPDGGRVAGEDGGLNAFPEGRLAEAEREDLRLEWFVFA